MRALIASDVHSNLEALQSVMADADARGGFDEIWSLGDLVGYGPDPAACVDALWGRPHRAVAGNHDLAAIGKISLDRFNAYAASANRWTAAQLSAEQAEFIAAQPLTLEADEFTLVHGSPRDPLWEYVVNARAAMACFTHMQTDWCLLGHSHIPFICRPTGSGGADGAEFFRFPLDAPVALGSEMLIVNPGSVGQPRDGDPRASYAVYDDGAQTIAHYRVAYDIAATQAKMRRAGLPQYLIDRLAVGR